MLMPSFLRFSVAVFNFSSLIVSQTLLAKPCAAFSHLPTKITTATTTTTTLSKLRIRKRTDFIHESESSTIIILSSTTNSNGDVGDKVLTSEPNVEKKETRKPKQQNQAKRERPRIPVLQYHDDWVCVSKPAGLTVHRSANTPRRQLVLSTLLKRQLSRKVFPVHRLDHRTSGAILFAFDSKTCSLLHQALTFNGKRPPIQKSVDARDIEGENDILKQDQSNLSMFSDDNYDDNKSKEEEELLIDGIPIQKSKKEYVALLRGDWKRKFGNQEEIIIDKPLNVKGISKDAKTIFKILSSTPGTNDMEEDNYYSPAACSLVLCTPLTGRTHQIRRHAYALGLPIIGDSEHGDSKINRWWRQNRDLNRLFLHCFNLDLPNLQSMEYLNESDSASVSMTGDVEERILCTAPLTEDLTKVMSHQDLKQLWEEAKAKDPRLTLIPFDNRGGTFGRNYREKKVNTT